MKHKINIHAHSKFSDGKHSVEEMAIKAKELGFSALVLTDHYYGGCHPDIEMTWNKFRRRKKEIVKARSIIPIIGGVEVAFGMEEFLLFGSSAINELISTDCLEVEFHLAKKRLKKLKEDHNCATVLCHPMGYYDKFIELMDGYEHYNCGENYFDNGRELGCLEGMQAWYNSDAHQVDGLYRCFNILDTKIETEDQLIDYIKSGKQHEFETNIY